MSNETWDLYKSSYHNFASNICFDHHQVVENASFSFNTEDKGLLLSTLKLSPKSHKEVKSYCLGFDIPKAIQAFTCLSFFILILFRFPLLPFYGNLQSRQSTLEYKILCFVQLLLQPFIHASHSTYVHHMRMNAHFSNQLGMVNL